MVDREKPPVIVGFILIPHFARNDNLCNPGVLRSLKQFVKSWGKKTPGNVKIHGMAKAK